MGLDMYAYTIDETPARPVDFDAGEEISSLHYWRKHPDLHGWMEALYRKKGGDAPQFNCVNLVLTPDDLDALERDIKAGSLPDTSGFFFGDSDGTETEDDLFFIAKARESIQRGKTVFYSSWW